MIKLPKIEPDLGPLESSYRQTYLKSDASQTIFVICLSNLASLALIPSDFHSFGLETKFTIVLVSRLVVFLISILTIAILLKSTKHARHDQAIAIYMVAGVLINIFFNSIKTPDYVTYLGVSIVLLNIHYFAFYTPFRVRTTISFLFSLVIVWQAYHSPEGRELGSVVAGMHLLTNVLGASISTKLHNQRRISYKAQTEEKELQEQLNHLANTDSLTRIWNRRKFTEDAENEFGRAKRYERPLVLMLIDIDQLKLINDANGHLVGDQAIIHSVWLLKSQIREQDIPGRLGGDEFGILLPETTLHEALVVAKRIQESSRRETFLLDQSTSRVTFSIGIAELTPKDQSFEDFIARADTMLYRAKQDRDCIEYDEVSSTLLGD